MRHFPISVVSFPVFVPYLIKNGNKRGGVFLCLFPKWAEMGTNVGEKETNVGANDMTCIRA